MHVEQMFHLVTTRRAFIGLAHHRNIANTQAFANRNFRENSATQIKNPFSKQRGIKPEGIKPGSYFLVCDKQASSLTDIILT